MRNKLLILAFILTMGRLSAAEFDPAACPDLSVKIFPGNNKRAVLLVSAQHYSHSGLGFEYVESSTIGSLARKSWRTIMHIKMGTGKKSPMYYLTTISQDAAKDNNRFELALDRSFFTGPKKTGCGTDRNTTGTENKFSGQYCHFYRQAGTEIENILVC